MGGAGLRAGGKVSAGWDREITELNTVYKINTKYSTQKDPARRDEYSTLLHFCQLYRFGINSSLWEKAPSSRRKGSTKNLVLRDTHVVR